MNQNSACPNCHAELKIGFLNSNKLLEPSQIAVINEYHQEKSEAYCNKCGHGLYDQYKSQLNKERKELVEKIQKLITAIPVISTHSPHNWDYNVLDMVTGQTTTGTGVISEFTSSFTDLFGAQSGRHNRKLKAGEDMCFAQLRKQTLDAGGNAVIATDIDYSELGATKGMIMVCMAGTAVKLKNVEALGKERAQNITELNTANTRFSHLKKYSD